MSLATLRSAATVRERCANITAAVEAGRSLHWTIDASKLDSCAAEVERVTRARYPDLAIPIHGRMLHFQVGGIDRVGEVRAALRARGDGSGTAARDEPGSRASAAAGSEAGRDARALIDLVTVSVLLDAGAGAGWAYREAESGQSFARSEGLAVASLRAFLRGAFSSDPRDPLRADAARLQALTAADLAAMFQVRADNPLVGLEGRAALLQRLGAALAADGARFGDHGRPGALLDALGATGSVEADHLLRALLDGFAPIWTAGGTFDGQPVGDAWRHPHAGGSGPTAGWVPFHKLTQWLTYSLVEPFAAGGVQVTQIDALTALPEYRNGGLLIDSGVVVPRDPALLARALTPADEPVIEWRALTVSLLDRLAPRVRARLGRSAEQLPLASILEGGTWAAGRALAQARRGGTPPLSIVSDGTVF